MMKETFSMSLDSDGDFKIDLTPDVKDAHLNLKSDYQASISFTTPLSQHEIVDEWLKRNAEATVRVLTPKTGRLAALIQLMFENWNKLPRFILKYGYVINDMPFHALNIGIDWSDDE